MKIMRPAQNSQERREAYDFNIQETSGSQMVEMLEVETHLA